MPNAEPFRSATSISKVLDLEFNELMLRVEVILPGGVCLSTRRIITRFLADDLIAPVKSKTVHFILQRELNQRASLKRQRVIHLLSEAIATQLAQALETKDNIGA